MDVHPAPVILTATAVGASHRRRSTDGDDAVGALAHTDAAMAVVADGHSDPRCTRARRGAELAVQAALQHIDAPAGAADLGLAVVRTWQHMVRREVAAEPEAGLTPLAFGTTVLICRAHPGGIDLAQIGDGDIVVARLDGTATRPFAIERTGGSGTDSLSDERAEDLLRAHEVEDPASVSLVALASDGVDNAYPDDAALLDAVLEIQEMGPRSHERRVGTELRRWVERAAATSGDDASVALLIPSPSSRPALRPLRHA